VVRRLHATGGADVGCEDTHLALLALEVGSREWKGFWTAHESLVTDLDEHIASTL
jgi:hypothetical protein